MTSIDFVLLCAVIGLGLWGSNEYFKRENLKISFDRRCRDLNDKFEESLQELRHICDTQECDIIGKGAVDRVEYLMQGAVPVTLYRFMDGSTAVQEGWACVSTPQGKEVVVFEKKRRAPSPKSQSLLLEIGRGKVKAVEYVVLRGQEYTSVTFMDESRCIAPGLLDMPYDKDTEIVVRQRTPVDHKARAVARIDSVLEFQRETEESKGVVDP